LQRKFIWGDWLLSIQLAVCIVVPLVFLNIPAIRDSFYIVEPLLILFLLSIIIISLLIFQKNVVITYFDVIFFFFILYGICINLSFGPPDSRAIGDRILIILSYISLKNIVSHTRARNARLLFFLANSISLLSYLVVFLVAIGGIQERIAYFFIPNSSAFSILLSAQLVFGLAFLVTHSKKTNRVIFITLFLLFFLSFVLFLLSQGRAGWLGFIAGGCYLVIKLTPHKIPGNRVIIMTSLIFIALIYIAFAFKPASSKGRLLIYKVSATIFKDHWLVGTGPGNFKHVYNQYQSTYFMKHGLGDNDAMLADNTIYAFNEPLEILIEYGLIGFLFFLTALGMLINRAVKIMRQQAYGIIAAAIGISIFVSSLFFYSFHIFPVLVLFLFCAAVLDSYAPPFMIPGNCSKFISYFLIIGAVIIAIFFWIIFAYRLKANEAKEWSLAGNQQKALDIYEAIYRSPVAESQINYLYARELYNMGKSTAALSVIHSVKALFPTNDVYMLSGKISESLGMFSQAERDYLRSIYMVPKRMEPRFLLYSYYLSRKDTVNAINWARDIQGMPVKVESRRANNIKKEIRSFLDSVGH
jgi:O-antigen ligase